MAVKILMMWSSYAKITCVDFFYFNWKFRPILCWEIQYVCHNFWVQSQFQQNQ